MSFRSVFVAVVCFLRTHRCRVFNKSGTAQGRNRAARRRVCARFGQVRRVPLTAAVFCRPRIRDEQARPEGRELPGMPPARAPGRRRTEHHGFVISARLTAGNCRGCHEQIYQQFLRSRHAATSWAAVYGDKGLTPEQVNFSRDLSAGRDEASAASIRHARRRLRDGQRLRAMPRDRQAQCRRHDRHLHQLPYPSHQFGGNRPPAAYLRAMPHGAGPFADRNLRRVETRHDVQRAGEAAQPRRAPEER